MEEVLNNMQDTFTSNEFFKVARENGHSIRILENGKAIRFLLSKGCQRLSKKTWRKPKEFQIESAGGYESAQASLQMEEALASQKLDLTANVIGAIGELVDESSSFGKSLAIAEAPQTEQQCIDFLKRTGKYKIMKITLQEL